MLGFVRRRPTPVFTVCLLVVLASAFTTVGLGFPTSVRLIVGAVGLTGLIGLLLVQHLPGFVTEEHLRDEEARRRRSPGLRRAHGVALLLAAVGVALVLLDQVRFGLAVFIAAGAALVIGEFSVRR